MSGVTDEAPLGLPYDRGPKAGVTDGEGIAGPPNSAGNGRRLTGVCRFVADAGSGIGLSGCLES